MNKPPKDFIRSATGGFAGRYEKMQNEPNYKTSRIEYQESCIENMQNEANLHKTTNNELATMNYEKTNPIHLLINQKSTIETQPFLGQALFGFTERFGLGNSAIPKSLYYLKDLCPCWERSLIGSFVLVYCHQKLELLV